MPQKAQGHKFTAASVSLYNVKSNKPPRIGAQKAQSVSNQGSIIKKQRLRNKIQTQGIDKGTMELGSIKAPQLRDESSQMSPSP